MKKYPLHLCQPDNSKSCGACCGLYNVEDHSRETLRTLLKQRAELFFSSGENPDVASLRRNIQALSVTPKLCETIHNCEFLGFVDGGEQKVGCMLHPVLHQGRDLRSCSFYGAELCANHFCISYTSLTTVEQTAVIRSLDDWYLFGLVLTDVDFVKAFFTHAQNRMGDSVRADKLEMVPVQHALGDYFALKGNWKFSSDDNRLGKYSFSQAEYRIARIDYEKNWDMRPSPFDSIFVSLASAFNSEDEVLEAEAMIEEKLRQFIEVCR